jgi:translation initiation factor IF-3
VNNAIREPVVRLIGPDGINLGEVPIEKALAIAVEADLDLVEVSPNVKPPVCRVMDYGKFLYEKTKKEREARKTQVKIEIKEIRLRPKTNEHHRSFKTRDARRWLLAGMKVKVTIRFRGREITYPEIALNDLKEIAEELADVSVIEQKPNMEGRVMTMVLGPITAAKPKKKAAAPKEPAESVQKTKTADTKTPAVKAPAAKTPVAEVSEPEAPKTESPESEEPKAKVVKPKTVKPKAAAAKTTEAESVESE